MPGLVIDALAEGDLPEAERIFRTAFGTHIGVPDPASFASDRDYVRGRFRAPHVAAFAARLDGHFAGSNFAINWGSLGIFGPLTVRPDLWNRGIAGRLVEACMAQFDAWGTRHAALFTFAESAKHVALYQKFGFFPRFLTAVMASPGGRATPPTGWSRFSAAGVDGQEAALLGCREVAETVLPGLDLGAEIGAVHDQGLGDTMLLEGAGGLGGFAICHYGPRSESGPGACYIKFAAIRATAGAAVDFARLLDACDAMAVAVRLPKMVVGVNLARHETYRGLLARGFRTEMQGVAMHRGNDPATCRPGIYVLDDWR